MSFRSHSTLYFASGIIFIALEAMGATWPEIIVALNREKKVSRQSYITAQYFIAAGCLKQYNIKFR